MGRAKEMFRFNSQVMGFGIGGWMLAHNLLNMAVEASVALCACLILACFT